MASRIRRASRTNPRLRQALEIVDRDYGKAGARERLRIPGVTRLGELFLFTRDERVQLRALRDLIERYVDQPNQPRPLSLAVFGPPGSGKSFAVKQILKQVEKTSKLKLSRTDVNLTQISDSDALGKILSHAGRAVDETVPVIFFDEFDAPKDGAPFGWLAWFLAPMQDGEFVSDGEVIPLHRAVYVFAGGTAATLQHFSDFNRRPEFQRAKGPDFISRLRGFLDVCGPNEEPRLLRRAVLLRAELTSRARRGGLRFGPDREVMEALLQVGRYRHGARSISAVVDLSHIDERRRRFGWHSLPKDHLLGLHIDRGPLDAKVIGGAIAFSGYSKKREVADLWRAVAKRLWEEGATLSYAGRWAEGRRGWLMKFLEHELRQRPPEPSALARRRGNPAPWLENFLDNTSRVRSEVNAAISLDERNRVGLHVTFASHLTKEERRRLDPWLRSVLEYFRRRLAVTDTSVARFVVAGAVEGFRGRFPGIPEEVMLSLAQKKPVYIVGALGGAAADVGSLLGLAHPRKGEVPASLRAEPEENEQTLEPIADLLRPGPWTDLPVTAAHLATFLKEHALGGPKWPKNGLTFDENRRLFASRDSDEVANLVMTGLLRRFATSAAVKTEQ